MHWVYQKERISQLEGDRNESTARVGVLLCELAIATIDLLKCICMIRRRLVALRQLCPMFDWNKIGAFGILRYWSNSLQARHIMPRFVSKPQVSGRNSKKSKPLPVANILYECILYRNKGFWWATLFRVEPSGWSSAETAIRDFCVVYKKERRRIEWMAMSPRA